MKTSFAAALLGLAALAPAAVAAPGGASASSSTPTPASVKAPAASVKAARPGATATQRVPTPASVKAPAASVKAARPGATATQRVPTPALAPVAGLPQLEAGIATRRSGKAASAATIAFVSRASAPAQVRVDLVRSADGLSIYREQRLAAPGIQQTIAWDGKAETGIALDGRYEVRLSSLPADAPPVPASPTVNTLAVGGASVGDAAPQGSPPPPGSAPVGTFTFLSAVFPVRGTHDYGQSGARFGSGRSGHSHEGQDVMARCGTPVVAARGGIVRQQTYHGAAGNYVVIGDPITGEDHAYMHFRDEALVSRGDRVETGQQIGVVGSTGSSTACHLHFEIWTAPGWYAGGSPIDPLATLKRWDKLS